ncbi:MAG: hypothetical protein ACI3VX_06685 [Faecousia sp.]
MMQKIIELTPYLPSVQAVEEKRPVQKARELLPFVSAAVESLATVGIGVCFLLGLIVTLTLI